MATEDEAREAADGEEVQVKAVDLGTTHLQMNLDGKLPSHGEMKDEAAAMDSTEGIKVTEDRVLEKAPSVVETPAEDTPNGTHSSLHGHMKEGKILNEEPQENGQKDNEQVVASPDDTSTDQSNTSNGEEATDSLVHVEKTAEDTSLLKQDQPEPKERHLPDVEGDAMEDKMVQEDTLQTDNDVEPKIDVQQGQNLEPAEVTEDTQHASMSCIPHDEVIAEAPAGVQTSLEPNVDDSNALPVTSDGNTETEPAKVDQESFPEDEHTNEAIKLEDQPSKQTDDVDASMVREEVPKSEDVTKSGQADESTNGDQEELNQESPEETSDPVHEKIEETSHDSNVSASETTPEHDATTREPALDVQEVQQDQGLAEEIADAKEVDTEKTVQQSGVAFEEATPEDNVAIIEPSSDIQHPNNVESEEIKTLEDAKSEETSHQSNVAIAEDATQDKKAAEDVQPVQGLEEEEPKSTETVEMDEASNQPQADVINNLAEEDSVAACQPQVIELKEEVKDTEVSEAQEICHERTVSASEEDCVEDDVTAEGPACDAQEVDNVASVEEIKDNTAENINEASSVATVEPQILEAEPAEEMKDSEATEPRVISQRSKSVPEDVTAKEAASDIKEVQTEELVEEPNGVKAEEISNQSSGTIVGETAQENKLLSSDPTNDVQERGLELQENGNNKDVQAEEASHQTHTEEILTEHEPQKATEDNMAILTDVSIQQLKEQEPVEFRDAEATEPQGISPSHIASTSEQSTPEDNETTEPSPATQAENLESAIVTEESKDVKSTDAIAEEETLEEHVQESEAPVDIPPLEEPELEETKNTEPVEVHDNVMTNDLTAEEVKDTEAIEVAEIHNESTAANICDLTEDAKSSVALEDDAAPDEHAKTTEATAAILQPQEPELEEIKNSETVEVEDDIIARGLPAEEIEDTEAMEIEMIPHESTGANIGELINDVKSNAALADEAAPDEYAKATEATAAIPQLQESELEEIKNSEPAEVEGNISESDLPAEKAKDTEAVETESINESTDANNSELTANVPSNVALTDEAAHDEHVTVTETTVDIPEAQEQKLEEIKNTEPVEVEENRSASDLPAEEVKETEAIKKSSDANISELTEDVKNNVALVYDAAPEEHVIATEATVDIPRAQETEQEIKNTEPAEVEGNVSANDLPAEEMKDTEAMETEGINESTDTNNRQLTEDVKNSVAFADEAAPEEHVTVADDTVDIPQAQEPEVEEIKNTEPVKMEENISERDLPAEEAKDTEAINESTDANISELTEDVKSNVSLADNTAPEEHVTATEATVDIPRAQEAELEEIKNSEPAEVEGNISAKDLPAEEVKDTEAVENEAINESTDKNNSELTEDVKTNVALADEAAPEEHVTVAEDTVDIPQAQEPEVEEIKSTEHVEVEENISARDLPAEEVKDTEAKETEAINRSIDTNTSELTGDVKSNIALADEAAPEEHVIATEATVDIPQAEDPELEEIKNTEPVEVEENISASDLLAEEVKDTEPKETEAINESTDANISELNEDVKSNVTLADEAAPEEHVAAAEASVDIAQAQVPEVEELKNVEPVEVEENRLAGDLPAEEVKETGAINESTGANISELTEDVTSNVTPADEAAPEEHVTATVDIPTAQEPELEEIENTEPVEVEENASASDLPAEEAKDTEAKETESIIESTDANISELTEDMKSNVVLTDEADHEEPVTVAERAVDIPQAQEPELEEIKNTEAGDLPAEEVKETEAINKSTDANISELNEDVKSNVALADEEAHQENVTVAEDTVDIPQAQVPELEEIKNIEHVEMEENRSASDLQTEEVKETEANISELTEDVTSNVAPADEAAPEEHVTATEATVDIPRAQEPELQEIKNTEPVEVEENISAINESTDANISELTEDVKGNVAHADEAVPEEHVIAAEATVDMPQAQVPELEELENAEPVEVEEKRSASDLPAEEVKDTENMETEATNESTDANISELTEDVALAEEEAPDVHLDIPPAQEPAPEETNNSEPVEAEDTITADNVPAEEIIHTKAMETEEIPRESTDHSLTASAPLPDNQQVLEQEAVEDKTCTDTTENQGEPQQSSVSTSAEHTPTEEKTTVVEHTQDTHVQCASSEPGSDPNLLVQSAHQSELAEDSESQLVKAEETGQSNDATLEEPTAEDNAANEIDPLADSKQEHVLESVEENKCTDASEGEEASHASQDPGLEEPVSESDIATVEPTSDIQQVNDMDEEEITATEAINDEEISCQKMEVATLEDPSPTDNGTAPKRNPVQLDEENLGNEINNAILADEKFKDEIQEPIEQKDESSDLGEKTAFTTQKDESTTEEDVVHISGEDTVDTSNNIAQMKEQSKSITEHDAIKSGDHTNDQDDKQLHNVEAQMQVCERSVDVLTMEQPDEDVQKVNLDQQQEEDEAIEEQTEEIERDEQKHDDSRADFTTETILDLQSNEIDTTNREEDADVFEAEQTETVTTEMLKNEQTLHIPQESIPSITDAKVENSTEIKETTEQGDAPNNTGTLYTDADAEKYNEDETENTEIDATVAKTSTVEQDGTTDETINEEVGNDLASPIEKDLQKTSDLAPSNEEMVENDPTVVPRNVESRVHTEEKECINKANDDMQAIQASEEEIVDEVEKKPEMQNEGTDVNHDEIRTKPVDEEASEQLSNNSTDTKMDDTMSPNAEMIHGRIDAQPIEIEEVEDKEFGSISEYAVEKSKQSDVEQDLSIHPKVVDDKLATEQNGAEVETDSNEEMATGYTTVTESVKLDEAIYDKASGADGALSDENLETIEDNRRNLEASPAVTASGESTNEDNEHYKLALPAHSTVDGDETEQASGLEVTERGLLFPEKPLPTESEEQEESQITKEQDEENVHEQETGDTEKEEKEAEQSDLPVSHFLMNLIMGKESNEPDGNSESEAKKKQEETTKDDSSLITSRREEILVPSPTENKVDNELIFEQGKHNLEGSEETHDIRLEKDKELSRNTHDLEALVCQNNVQGETSSELVPAGPGLITEMETRDIKLDEKATNSVCQEHVEVTTQTEEGSLKSNLDDIKSPKASQEDTLEEGRRDLQHEPLPENTGSDAVFGQTLLSTEPNMGDEKNLPNDTDDLQSPLSTKREESNESSIIGAESTIEDKLENEVDKEEENQHTTTTGGATEEQIENMHDNSQKGTEAISDEQKGEITEPVMRNEINLVREKEISAGSECKEETQSYKFSNSELDNSEKPSEIQLDGSKLHIDQDKQDESAGGEKNNLLDKPKEPNLQKEQETDVAQKSPKESYGGDQNCLDIREPLVKEVNVNKTVGSHVQTVNTQSHAEQDTFNSQVQERDLDMASPEEPPEAEEKIVESKREFSTDEEQIPKKDNSNMAGEETFDEKRKDIEEAKSSTDEGSTKIEEQGAVQKAPHDQKRDLDVVSPTEAPGREEKFVDTKKAEFSTDEEPSPKKDGSNMAEERSYDKKTNGDEEAKNFTDDAPMQIEEREAGQKASPKKHNILSGVGSKVKHQLAKVKKAIIGKPGHTKSESPKA